MVRVKVINQKRTSLKIQMTTLANHVASNRYDQTNLKMRLNRVTVLWHAYEELHDELAILDPNNEHLDEIHDIRDQYYDVASKIEAMAVAGTSTPRASDTLGNATLSATRVEGRRSLKLPVAELPKFDGSLEKWLSYKNAFVTMIDERDDITDLEKFLYLKNSLKGDALNKVLLFNVSAENYQNAWRLLVDSYEKRRILVSKHVDAILDTNPPNKVTANGLAKIIDDVRQHINMLQSLGVSPEDRVMVIRVLERALPREIRQKWEESLSLDVLPTLEQLYKFVNETSFRLLTLEQNTGRDSIATGGKRPFDRESRAVKTRKTESGMRAFATGITSACTYCKQQHFVRNCPTLAKMTTRQRWDAVKRRNLCRNCLRSHRDECKSSRCRHCGRFHHSLLHPFEPQQIPAGQSTAISKSTSETGDSKNLA